MDQHRKLAMGWVHVINVLLSILKTTIFFEGHGWRLGSHTYTLYHTLQVLRRETVDRDSLPMHYYISKRNIETKWEKSCMALWPWATRLLRANREGKRMEERKKKIRGKKRKNSLLPWNLLHGAWRTGHGDSRSKYIL